MFPVRFVLVFALSFTLLGAPIAQAESLDPCRIKASDWQVLSLGFPVRPERLANLSAPKILVIPFQLQDTPDYVFSSDLKQNYQEAANQISEFSNGKSKLQFVFSPVIKTEITQSDMRNLRSNQNIGNQRRDESISTWGFVRNLITKYDSQLDFTGISGIILEGSFPGRGIAEAMTYIKNYDPYYRPLKTDEGDVLNAVLMDGHWDASTIAHEVMHLYGLTDLYGSETGPGRLSMMSSNALNLLSYEKWILGWLPDSEVKCLANISENSITKFTLDYTKINQLTIIRGVNKEIFIAETTKVENLRYLAFYSLDNDARPPITLYQERARAQNGGVSIENHNVIGTQFKSPNFTLLVTDLDSATMTLQFVPNSLTLSPEFKDLLSKSFERNAQIESEVQAKRITEGELKEKRELAAKEAAAKAATDLKAQQEAVAKAAVAKKTTITCIKGKITKKVTAVSPKCPSGYSKR